jgi:hypothetical protein
MMRWFGVWTATPDGGFYITKLDYAVAFGTDMEAERKWWWEDLWKIKVPLKIRTFLRLILSSKILT